MTCLMYVFTWLSVYAIPILTLYTLKLTFWVWFSIWIVTLAVNIMLRIASEADPKPPHRIARLGINKTFHYPGTWLPHQETVQIVMHMLFAAIWLLSCIQLYSHTTTYSATDLIVGRYTCKQQLLTVDCQNWLQFEGAASTILVTSPVLFVFQLCVVMLMLQSYGEVWTLDSKSLVALLNKQAT